MNWKTNMLTATILFAGITAANAQSKSKMDYTSMTGNGRQPVVEQKLQLTDE